MDTSDNAVAVCAFIAVRVFAGLMRVNANVFHFGTANRALRAFALG
jgi:hypothetical protein